MKYISFRGYQEYTFRHRSACRTPPERGHEYLNTRKEYIEPHKTQYDEVNREKIGELVGLDPPLVGGGTDAGV